MANKGIFFALPPLEEKRLLTAEDDDALLGVIQADLVDEWDVERLQDVEESWNALHRCLSDGTLHCKGNSPLVKCVLGGRQLYSGKDYTASYLTAEEVKAMAAALTPISRQWFRKKYFGMEKYSFFHWNGYQGKIDVKDFETTWLRFTETRAFFQQMATNGLAMLFTVHR